MATVASVALTQPASDPNINEGQTFTMGAQITSGAHGGLDYDIHYQWDQGTGTWVDIPSSGADLTTAATNPELSAGDSAEHTITITGVNASNSNVRIRTVDNNDSSAEDLSSSQAVTVNVGTITGDLAVTEGSDTAAVTGDVVVQGDSASTEISDAVAVSADVIGQGDLAATEGPDVVAMSGTVGATAITGDLAVTEGADVVAASGDVIDQGDLAVTEQPDTVALAGDTIVQGVLGVTELPDSFAAAGLVLIEGDMAITENPDIVLISSSAGLTFIPTVTII